jgi:hypothetical protein
MTGARKAAARRAAQARATDATRPLAAETYRNAWRRRKDEVAFLFFSLTSNALFDVIAVASREVRSWRRLPSGPIGRGA